MCQSRFTTFQDFPIRTRSNVSPTILKGDPKFNTISSDSLTSGRWGFKEGVKEGPQRCLFSLWNMVVVVYLISV